MTIEERTKVLVKWIQEGVCKHQPATPQCSECMTAGIIDEITQACAEARRDAIIEFCEGDSCKLAEYEHKAYEKGFAEGRRIAFSDAKEDMRKARVDAKIEEASYWALSHAEHEADLEKKFTLKGFAVAREEAAKIADEYAAINRETGQSNLPERIRAMRAK